MELNEFQTRKQKIDIMLKEQGWVVGDRTKVIVEVDTKQSDFRAQNYKTVSETLKNDMESKYVDYLKLDRFGAPIAIIEAKRTSRDPILTAQKQAEEYANDIKAQTGKTRVAMAIIDVLLKAGWAEKILFLTDRRALRKQAYDDGFKRFFPEEAKSMIHSGVFNRNSRLYVFTYLDGIQIGLTATPADFIERDTFRFFGCENKVATALYDYEEAVRDGVLCDFRKNISGARTHF